MKCHDVAAINEAIDKMGAMSSLQSNFGIHKGYKFDNKSHSWLYMSGNVCLSYSYMTFVINQTMQQKQEFMNDDFLFDVE